MRQQPCVVCAEPTSDMVRPFGIFTDAVPAHHYHDDWSIRTAWTESDYCLRDSTCAERVAE